MTNRNAGTFFAACLALLLVGCNSGEMDKLEKQNQEILAQLHRLEISQKFDREAKCSQAAKEYFRDNWRTEKDQAALVYSNRDNTALNKCFIYVKSMTYMNAGNEWRASQSLSDVYERTEYGSFLEVHKSGPSDLHCEVEGKSCTSQSDFESRIVPYTTN